jgi:hypothetical protein
MVKRSEKGDYYRKAQNHPEECQFQGQKFAFRAGNSAPRARISAPGQNFWGPEIPEFLALRNLAKSFRKHCSAMFCKGPRNSGFAEFLGARNFINRPSKIRPSPIQQAVVQLAGRGQKF